MKTNRARRGIFALVAAALVAAAGGIAYASIPDADGTYHACMLKNVGTIRIIDPERQRCSTHLEVEITFAKQGPQGEPGPAGPPGPPGPPGADGEDFAGTFTSPNGTYSLSVTDAGIVLSGAGSRIELTAAGVEVRSGSDLDLLAANDASLDGGVTATLEGGAGATVRAAGFTSVEGGVVRLGSAPCLPAARLGDLVTGSVTPAGTIAGGISTGSLRVCVG